MDTAAARPDPSGGADMRIPCQARARAPFRRPHAAADRRAAAYRVAGLAQRGHDPRVDSAAAALPR
ncbi:hypothetical protein BVI2075_150002 [Burkholderia vietnamiensis]|nr:hypothetical protein BVI2075_150002 [Burkholderia vietnamiensis]